MVARHYGIINQLRKDISRMQGFKPVNTDMKGPDLGPIKNAFPNGIFPTGTIHEFVSEKAEGTAASQLEAGMPGVGFLRWNVELSRVRNGKSGNCRWNGASNDLT